MAKVFVYDPTITDKQSAVRGIGRYLNILKENFPQWHYINHSKINKSQSSVFINPFFNFLQPPLTLKKIAAREIAVIHDLIPLKYPNHFPTGLKGKINIFLNKLALKSYDLIVTDSFSSKKDMIEILKIKEQKIKVISPCLSRIFLEREGGKKNKEEEKTLASFSRKFSLPNKFCLYVGDGTWNKNLVNLAKAIKIINLSCVFVGRVFNQKKSQGGVINFHPWQKELDQFFKLTKNDKRFIFIGYVSDEELISLYRRATVNVLVSRDEGFGFSYLEAASQGCPSVVSNIAVLKEVSQGQGVLLVDSNNPNDIADKIGEIYFNKSLRDRLGKEAKERGKWFSREKFHQNFLEIID